MQGPGKARPRNPQGPDRRYEGGTPRIASRATAASLVSQHHTLRPSQASPHLMWEVVPQAQGLYCAAAVPTAHGSGRFGGLECTLFEAEVRDRRTVLCVWHCSALHLRLCAVEGRGRGRQYNNIPPGPQAVPQAVPRIRPVMAAECVP